MGSMAIALELAAIERLWGNMDSPRVCSQSNQDPDSIFLPPNVSPPGKENTHTHTHHNVFLNDSHFYCCLFNVSHFRC